jgi:hypothetical protein
MNKKNKIKYINEGKYVAKVAVNLIEDNTHWSPYLSVEDASKLDEVRRALKHGNIQTASKLASVFILQPV